MRYRVFGDRVDGTYLAIDTTHAHINMPAAMMWARGLDDRPATLTFEPPAGHALAASRRSCMPGPAPFEFTAPNLQYLMDSPAEFGPVAIRAVHGRTAAPSGLPLHHTGTDAELDGFVTDVEKIVREEGAIYGEYPGVRAGHTTRSSPTTCRGPTATAWSIATAP